MNEDEINRLDVEADKWFAEIQSPATTEKRRQEMFLQEDKENVLEDLKGCPLTREQVKALFKLRDSFDNEAFENAET